MDDAKWTTLLTMLGGFFALLFGLIFGVQYVLNIIGLSEYYIVIPLLGFAGLIMYIMRDDSDNPEMDKIIELIERKGNQSTSKALQTSKEPKAPLAKTISFITAFLCLASIGLCFHYLGGVLSFLAAAGCLGLGILFITIGWNADERHAQIMKVRAEAKASHLEYEKSNVQLEQARTLKLLEIKVATERAETEKKKLEFERKEIDVRESVSKVAEDNGLDIDSVIELNNHKYTKAVDIQYFEQEEKIKAHIRREDKILEIESEQESAIVALDAADRVEYYRIIGQLEDELEELLVRRRDVELNETDKKLKRQRLARLNKRITQLEADIDARQNRLLSTSNGKETKRLT